MTHTEEYEQFLRECGPVLQEMARRLGSWEAVGAQLERDCKLYGETYEITPTPEL